MPAYEYDLNDDERELARLIRDFADEVVAPRSYAADTAHELPLDIVAQMGEMGLFGLPFPEEYGDRAATTSLWVSRSRPSGGLISPSRSRSRRG